MSKLKKTILIGSFWSIIGFGSSLIITLVTNIWLARILSPEEFGQVGIIMFFILIANVLMESGLGGALVRKSNATRADYSTVFVANLVFSILFYIILVISSSAIADFYNNSLIKNLLIVAGFVLIINAFQLTQSAKLVSDMKFKERSIYRFIAVFASSVIGIYFAYLGLGVWSLVLIQLMTATINTVLLWIFEGFYMRFYFSKSSFKELYSFGVNTTLASILNTGFDNIYQLVLGKYFSLSQTGYFYQAKKLQDVPGGMINMLSQSVVFSSLAKLQDDKLAFIKVYNKIALYFLVMLGLISSLIYLYSEQIILLLYGNKWIGAVFYMQLLTIASFFHIQENINRVIFKVFNQTRKILHLEFVKKTIQAFSIIIGIYYLNLQILIIGFVITNIISYFVNYYYSRKVLGVRTLNEIKVLAKIIVISILGVISITIINNYFQIEGLYILLSFPVLIVLYLLCIQYMRIMNLKKEVMEILKLYR